MQKSNEKATGNGIRPSREMIVAGILEILNERSDEGESDGLPIK